MEERQHESLARWERRWLAVVGVMLVVFVIFMAAALSLQSGHIGQQTARGTPAEVGNLDYFADPGPVELERNRFEVGLVAQSFSFTPSLIQLPVGAQATFFMTSRDVLHGFQVQNTNINVELMPGEVSSFTYTFDRPGSYRISCNEYCGIGHQNMLATIEVVDRRTYDQARLAQEAPEAVAGAEAGVSPSFVVGETVYNQNCAGCHQADGTGIASVFPPLVEHVVHVYQVDGGREYLIDVLLYGLQGPIIAEGTTYDGVMPAWSQLSDEEIAGTLNYVLQAWGNDALHETEFSEYEPAEVMAAREDALSPQQVLELRRSLELEE